MAASVDAHLWPVAESMDAFVGGGQYIDASCRQWPSIGRMRVGSGRVSGRMHVGSGRVKGRE
eukprot:2345823-Amphidinium_carterae.1